MHLQLCLFSLDLLLIYRNFVYISQLVLILVKNILSSLFAADYHVYGLQPAQTQKGRFSFILFGQKVLSCLS